MLAQVDIGEKFVPPIKDLREVGGTVSALVSNLIIFGGILFLVLVAWAGFEYIRGAGSADQERLEKAKKILTGTIIGFLIIFASYWIIKLIETITRLNIL